MIAVTGANGLLGEYIVQRLVDEKRPVIVITRTPPAKKLASENILYRTADITDIVSVKEALEGATSVIHAAAFVSLNPRSRDKVFDINVNGTKNVVDACLHLNIPTLVHVSSGSTIGKPKGVSLLDEETKWIPGKFNTLYAETKYLAELEVHRGAEEGLNTSIVNPSVILAPSDWTRSSAKFFKFVWDEKFYYTDGQFNYVDARDVVEMILRLLEGNHLGEKFLASAGSVSFIDFFTAVATRFNKRPPSMNMPHGVIHFFAFLDGIMSRITGKDPLIDRKALRTNREKFVYSNQKAINQLKIRFRTLEETLDWCCPEYLTRYTTNK